MLLENGAHVSVGCPVVCCLVQKFLMTDFIPDRFGRGEIMMKPTSRGPECLIWGFCFQGLWLKMANKNTEAVAECGRTERFLPQPSFSGFWLHRHQGPCVPRVLHCLQLFSAAHCSSPSLSASAGRRLTDGSLSNCCNTEEHPVLRL